MNSVEAQKLLRESGLNPALPFAIFDNKGALLFANLRMQEILLKGVSLQGDAQKRLKTPMSSASLEALWPFFNESKAAPALLKQVLSEVMDKNDSKIIFSEAYLKTYRLHLKSWKQEKLSGRIVVAEMVRSGDLMQDEQSRQVLFRSLSHEIRTAVMALKGYTEMLGDDPSKKMILDGMAKSLRRLDSVVERLEDFKVELKVLQDDQ